MVTKQKIKQRKIRVLFAMPAIDDCNCLYLVGTFNGWNESVYRMQRAEDGTWQLALELSAANINIAFARIKASGTTIQFPMAMCPTQTVPITLLSVFRAEWHRPEHNPDQWGNLIFFYC
jgi:hypothetical protein